MIRREPDFWALPQPSDGEVALLLQTIWDQLAASDHWPTYRTVDRLLYQERRIDVETVVARTPETMLLGGRPPGGAPPHPNVPLSLTVGGAAACNGSQPAVTVFLAAVRRAVDAELQVLPTGQDAIVTFDDAAAAISLELTESEFRQVARQSGLLLQAEPWSGRLLLYQGGWQLTVDRRVRPYAAVTDLLEYWRLREAQRRSSIATVPTPDSPAKHGGDGVIEVQGRRWWLGPELGSGGFGQVFAAANDTGAEAAVKFVPKQPGAERELLFADLEGVRNVVPVLGSGEVDEAWVLVMPRAQESLQQRLQQLGALPATEALAVLRDVATALADLAARPEPVVHRDLKPANVLVLNGRWCLADFGISRYAEASTAPDTRKHAMSAAYAAPERWRAERATAAADVYAAGVLAFELLSGARPFPGPGWDDFRDQHLHADPPPLPGVSPRLAALVAECLQKAPQARPTPATLLARLDKAGGGEQAPGAGALAVAYQRHVGDAAAQGASASRPQRTAAA